MAGFKRNARVVKQAVDDMMNVPFQMVKDQMVSTKFSQVLSLDLTIPYLCEECWSSCPLSDF